MKKNVTYVTLWGAYMFSKSISVMQNNLLGCYSQFGNLTLWLALFRSHVNY